MSDDAAIRALVFDVGQVIVRIDVDRAAAALALSSGRTAGQVIAAIEADPRMRDFQEGRLTPRDWHKHLARRLGFELSFEQFCAFWSSALDRETLLDDDLFAQLADRYPLVLLSNTDPIHVAHLTAHFSFLRHFAARVYSCAVGSRKPAAAIYRAAIAEAGVEPYKILYVDDVPEYVEAGRRAGMQTHHFRGPAPLIAELRARHLVRWNK